MCTFEGCSEISTYYYDGIKYPKRCDAHALSEMYKLTERCEEKGCFLRSKFKIDKKQLCRTHFQSKRPRSDETNETNIPYKKRKIQ